MNTKELPEYKAGRAVDTWIAVERIWYKKAQQDMLKAGYRKLPDKESIRVKLIQLIYGDVTTEDFVEWIYEV